MKVKHVIAPTASTLVAITEDGELWERSRDEGRDDGRGGAVYKWRRMPGPHDDHDPAIEAQLDQIRRTLHEAKKAK